MQKEGVSINRSIWGASILGTALFVIMGLFGGWAFKYPPNTNILDVLIRNATDVARLLLVSPACSPLFRF